MAIKAVLVTGSEGYIGSVLCPLLQKKGFDVIGLDTNFFNENSLGSIKKTHQLIVKDIRNIDKIDLHGIDAIIHLAALSTDGLGERYPKETFDINYTATVNMAKKAKSHGVERFIFASSCTIYGITKSNLVYETSPVDTKTAYSKSKYKAEGALINLADNVFVVSILRNSTVYGFSPRFRADVVVNNFITCALAQSSIRVLSDGTPWRPQIDIRDLSGIIAAFLVSPQKKIQKQIVNIGFNANNFQVNEILKIVLKQLPHCSVVYTREHGKDTRSYRVSFDKFHRLFPKIKQQWPLEKSIIDMIKNLKMGGFSKKEYLNQKYMRLPALEQLIKKNKLTKFLYWI